MIECDICPLCRLMTASTARTKLTFMGILRGVTGEAIFRCAFILSVHMTGFTSYSLMRANERECSFAVIKDHVLPTTRCMALGTFRPELTFMDILGCVTGYAVFRGAFKNTVYMAGLASYARVLSD